MLGELVKAVPERALEAELTAHLGYGLHCAAAAQTAEDPARGAPLAVHVAAVPAHSLDTTKGLDISG